jgi:hypothetical protein
MIGWNRRMSARYFPGLLLPLLKNPNAIDERVFMFRRKIMELLLIILVLVFLFGGGGYYGFRRWR